MAYAVVLDADVLHPYNLADLLLRLCERGLFRVAWSGSLNSLASCSAMTEPLAD